MNSLLTVCLAFLLSGCISNRVQGAWVYGPGRRYVTLDDIHAAIAADQADKTTSRYIYKIEVVNANEMHVFHTRNDPVSCTVIERIKEKWVYTQDRIVVDDLELHN